MIMVISPYFVLEYTITFDLITNLIAIRTGIKERYIDARET